MRSTLLPLALAVAGCTSTESAAPATTASSATATAGAVIDQHLLEAHVRFLSGDLLEGRGVGTRGDELARHYLATQMQSLGLRPAGIDGSWFQPVPILGIETEVQQTLSARGTNGHATFQAPDDFTAVAGNPEAAAAWQDAELVFVGYGIHAPEQQWDDFGTADLRGKVLLFMNSDPADDPERFAGKARLYYGRWSYKYEEAARRGALGAIVIHTNESAGYPYQVVQTNHGRENFWLPFRAGVPTLGIRSWATETAARQLCALGGHDLDFLRAAAERGGQKPVPLGVTLGLSVTNTVRAIASANVAGVLPGSDPVLKDQHVVVTAHFDHLGIGKPRGDDAIYNGAADNASGCAGLLALAKAAAALPVRPRRSLLFLAVTAEESGLLGSQFFAENPTVPAPSLVANVNVDGLNIWGRTHDVEFIGHGKNSLTALADTIAKAHGRRLEPDSNPDLGLFYRSDHFNFARIGVPAAYLKAGRDFVDAPEDRRRMKNSYTTVHYHQPSDEIAPWWKFDGATADLQLLFELLVVTADAEAAPTWTPGDEFAHVR
jgi:Zn-dependent M28 family amino/carboxypeptidase